MPSSFQLEFPSELDFLPKLELPPEPEVPPGAEDPPDVEFAGAGVLGIVMDVGGGGTSGWSATILRIPL